MKINHKGFSVVEVLVMLVLAMIIGGVGLLVYGRQKSSERGKQSSDLFAQTQTKCGKDPYSLVTEKNWSNVRSDYVSQVKTPVNKPYVQYYCDKKAAINASRGLLHVDGKIYDRDYEAMLASLKTGQKYYRPSIIPDGLEVDNKNKNIESKTYAVEYKVANASGQSTLPPLDLTCEYDKESLGLGKIQKDTLPILGKTDSGKPIIKIPAGTNQYVSLKVFLDDATCSAISTDKSISENTVINLLKSITEVSPEDFLAFYK